jgi:hypothetical protein
MSPFDRVSRSVLAPERNLPLEADLVAETNDLAVAAILGILEDGERCEAARADATGARNIKLASDLRKQLKERTSGGRILSGDAHEIAAETRESFRRAIHGKLVLPHSIGKLAA